MKVLEKGFWLFCCNAVVKSSYATTVKVLKTIEDGSNTYLSSTNGFSVDKESDEKYNIYTKWNLIHSYKENNLVRSRGYF